MALTINPATQVITIPQADLTLISGTLYELDTNAFRKNVMALLDDEDYVWMPNAFNHNTEVTVAGVTFARTLEFINGYSIEFEDGTYSVRLEGSNNNIFDVENGILVQNNVQVIAQNSAGLVNATLTSTEIAAAVWDAAESSHTTAGTFGALLTKVRKIIGNRLVVNRTNKDAIIYDDDGTTPEYTIDPFPVDATDNERGAAS